MSDTRVAVSPVDDLLLAYRLKAVRVGVVTTMIVVAVLLAFPLLPGHGEIHRGPYIAVVIAAAAGALVVARWPWTRVFLTPAGVWHLYAWSALDIVLITVGVAATGGGRSDLIPLYVLTTVFAASSYPRRGQIAVLAFTDVCLLGVMVLGDTSPGAAAVVMDLVVLGCVTLLAAFLSGQLVERIAAEASTRAESERRALLLGSVASAARAIADLDADVILQRVVDGVTQLGFSAANMNILDADEPVYRVAHARGLPEAYAGGVHPVDIGMVGMVRESGSTVVINDYLDNPRGVPQLRRAGFRAVVAVPIWVEGRLAAVLVGGSRERQTILPEETEAMELLAGQAGVALTNAERFEAERAMVRQLAELGRLKQDFISTVSHELRTPLTVIQGLGKTLEQRWHELDDDLRRELLERMNANASVLGGTINSLLDFAQLEAGRLEARPLPFDVSGSVTLAAARLASLFGVRSLLTRIEPGCWVIGDQHLIERVVDNLLGNAAKHTPDTAEVVVSVVGNEEEAVVSVVDNGPGIPESDLAHLGERFFRGGEAKTRRARGTGLGLAFAREVMALHGQPLAISSVPGRTEFMFRLPRAYP